MAGLIDGWREQSRNVPLGAEIRVTREKGPRTVEGYVLTDDGYVIVASRKWATGESVTEVKFIYKGREYVRWIGEFMEAEKLKGEALEFARKATRIVIPEKEG